MPHILLLIRSTIARYCTLGRTGTPEPRSRILDSREFSQFSSDAGILNWNVMTEVARILDALRKMGWNVTLGALPDQHVSISAKHPGGGGFYFSCHESDLLERLAEIIPEEFSGPAGNA